MNDLCSFIKDWPNTVQIYDQQQMDALAQQWNSKGLQ